ncbi:MAG: alpha/beta hydrolase [Thermomicrobiales bacterium]|nr:alpha/beta hydrolase [Thermomicrobiales bacterium]
MSGRAPHGTVRVGDSDLAYVSEGDGDAMVFVHGSVSDYRSWRDQISFFATSYRALSYSRRYHWPNAQPDPAATYGVAQHVADLSVLIEALDLAPVRLVGSSYGAMAALTLTVMRPELVRTLVLGEPPLLPWLETAKGGAALQDAFMTGAFRPAHQAFERGEPETGVRTFINGVIGPGAFDRLSPPAREVMLDNAAAMRAETATPPELYFSSLSRDDVREMTTPALLVEGAQSPRMFGVITDELARVLPEAERVMIPATAHGMHSQNPAAYNKAFLAFQARH